MGNSYLPKAEIEQRVRAALAGRSGEVLRLMAIQPKKPSRCPPKDMRLDVVRFNNGEDHG
jgi:hypothetical protein